MIFSRFDKFLPTFLVILITFLVGLVISVIGIPVIGRLFSLAAGSLVSLISFMAIGYVIDKDLSPVDAIKRSLQAFFTEPLAVWIYSLAIFIIGGIGALFFFFPVVFTMPFGVIGAVLAYNELSAREPGALNLEKVDKKPAGRWSWSWSASYWPGLSSKPWAFPAVPAEREAV